MKEELFLKNDETVQPKGDYSAYVHFEIDAQGKPFLVGGPGLKLDRDQLFKSSADVISQLQDGAIIDAFVREVSKAIKCSTLDLNNMPSTEPLEKLALGLQHAPVKQKAITGFRTEPEVIAPLGTVEAEGDVDHGDE